MGYSKPLPDQLDGFRLMGDHLADSALSLAVENSGDMDVRMFFDRLINQVDIPAEILPFELKEFLAQVRLPDWLDTDKVRISEEVFRRHGPRILLVLYFKSLPTLYACANGAEVLLHTGRLTRTGTDSQIFARRIAETGKFMIRVCGPLGLSEGGGLEVIAKVRLIHASIRFFVQKGRWDKEGMGVPINQEDMALTLQTFSSSVIEGMKESGIRLDPVEVDAMMHHWRVVGYCLGVDPGLLPETFEQGIELRDLILIRQVAPSEGGKRLTHALIAFTAPFFPKRLGKPSMWIIDYFVNDDIAHAIELKGNLPWYLRFLPDFLQRFFSWSGRLIESNDKLQLLLDKLSLALTRGMVNFFHLYDSRVFRLPGSLKRNWELSETEDHG